MMIPENTETQITMEGLKAAREFVALKEKVWVDADGCLPPPPPPCYPTPTLKEAVEYFEARAKLGYPEYVAICSFNGWTIQQTQGKRTP